MVIGLKLDMEIAIIILSIGLLGAFGYIAYKNSGDEKELPEPKIEVHEPTVRRFTYLKDNNTGIIRKVDESTPRINIQNSQVTIHNIVIDRTGNQELKKLDIEDPLENTDEYLQLVAQEYEKLSDKYGVDAR